jgi:lipoprotein-anchoring transpeptidase ErfK/SrfK
MFRKSAYALMLSAAVLVAGLTDQAAAQYATQASYNSRANMGGGFIEFLFGEQPQQTSPYQQRYQTPQYAPQPVEQYQPQQQYYQQQPMYQQEREQAYEPVTPARPGMDPKFLKQTVNYSGRETPGTIVIDTPSKFLYLVQGDGQALRYGIGVGKPGFTWSGVKTISMKKEWPSWVPPAEMLKRRPDLPALHGRRPGESAWRPCDVSRLDALPHSRFERAVDDRLLRCRRAASACATRTSSTSTTASGSAPASW